MMNLARAREVLLSPDTPWSTDVKRDLAQAYIDHTQALMLLNTKLDELEREVVALGNDLTAASEELTEARTILRGLYP